MRVCVSKLIKKSSERFHRAIRPACHRLKKNVILAVCFLLATQHGWAWERDTDITVTPWYKGAQTRAEFQKPLVFIGFGHERRDLRLKAEGLFGRSFDTDECAKIAQPIMEKMDRNGVRLPGRTYDGHPVYFAPQRFFLISIEPVVLVIAPAPFSFKRIQPSVENRFLDEVRSQYHQILERERKVGLSSLLTQFKNENWFNYLELSHVIPAEAPIYVMSELWEKPVLLSEAEADARWPFKSETSERFPNHLEIVPRRDAKEN